MLPLPGPGGGTNARAEASLVVYGCGSKIGIQHGTLLNGQHDGIPRSPGGFILTHTHMEGPQNGGQRFKGLKCVGRWMRVVVLLLRLGTWAGTKKETNVRGLS